jgi:hypothetical protein
LQRAHDTARACLASNTRTYIIPSSENKAQHKWAHGAKSTCQSGSVIQEK